MADRFADWFCQWSAGYTREQFDDILDFETGGMLEVWAQLLQHTGAEKYRTLLQRYYRQRLFTPLLEGKDVLTNMHANTTIPEVLGCARAYEVTGEQRWRDIVEAYWKLAVDQRGQYATGGQTSGEIWSAPQAPVDSRALRRVQHAAPGGLPPALDRRRPLRRLHRDGHLQRPDGPGLLHRFQNQRPALRHPRRGPADLLPASGSPARKRAGPARPRISSAATAPWSRATPPGSGASSTKRAASSTSPSTLISPPAWRWAGATGAPFHGAGHLDGELPPLQHLQRPAEYPREHGQIPPTTPTCRVEVLSIETEAPVEFSPVGACALVGQGRGRPRRQRPGGAPRSCRCRFRGAAPPVERWRHPARHRCPRALPTWSLPEDPPHGRLPLTAPCCWRGLCGEGAPAAGPRARTPPLSSTHDGEREWGAWRDTFKNRGPRAGDSLHPHVPGGLRILHHLLPLKAANNPQRMAREPGTPAGGPVFAFLPCPKI